MSRWARVFEKLLAGVFPSACCGCGTPGVPLCANCLPQTPVRRLITGDMLVSATGQYSGPLRRAILQFKRGRRDTGAVLSAFLAGRVVSRLGRGTVLVPVPTAATRRRERGFDQSLALAQACGERSGLPVIVALRQITSRAQRGRSRLDRLRARGRFTCTAPSLVAGIRVVLVDDVVTTGATLRDCAATLRACGAIVDEAIVLAYA